TAIGHSVSKLMGRMGEAGAGGYAGWGGGAGFGFRSVGARSTELGAEVSVGGRAGFGFSGSVLRAPCSLCLSIVNGCHPTVRIPSADSANKPINTAPALPTALSTPFARKAGNSPTRRSVRVQLA